MGNYSILEIHSINTGQTETQIIFEAYAKYRVPLFWIALFQKQDIKKYAEENNGEEELFYYQFEASVDHCITTFQQRFKLWPTLIQSDYISTLAHTFLDFLTQFQGQKVILNLNDVLSMSLAIYNQEGLDELEAMIQFIDEHLHDPQKPIIFKQWLPEKLTLNKPTDRYDLDGLGAELLPYPELDTFLEHHSSLINKTPQPKIKHEEHKIKSTSDVIKQNRKPKVIYLYCITILIILILFFYLNA